MKQLYQVLLLLFLPLFLASCEEGVFEPQPAECLEVRQEDDAGNAWEKVYDGQEISQQRYLKDQSLQYYYSFVYGDDGRVSEIQYLDAQGAPYAPSEFITYDEEGRWSKSTVTYPNDDITTYSIEYDTQGQLQKITSSTDKSGTVTQNYTATYTWMNGNNVSRTYASASQQQEIQYEFDLDQENKRRKEQKKVAFLSLAVAYNQNMIKRVRTVTTSGSTKTITESAYDYEYNEEGYPSSLTRTTTVNSDAPSTSTTSFMYDCD
jgi:hypothetical protein